MSNIIKWNYVNFDDNDRHLIDSDHSEKVKENILGEANLEQIAGIHIATPQDIADSFLMKKGDDTDIAASFQDGMNVINYDKLMQEERERIAEQADSLISDAKEKADAIVERANNEADQIKANAYEEGKNNGYQEGICNGQIEIEEQMKALAQKEEELSNQILKSKSDYNQKIQELEPFFVNLCMSLLEKITGVVVSDKKEVIMHLIRTGMEDAGRSQHFFIHVSDEDYAYVKEHKEDLMNRLSEETSLEIVEDADLHKNQCVIETDNRMIDSSLDIQLRNLIEDLRILSV